MVSYSLYTSEILGRNLPLLNLILTGHLIWTGLGFHCVHRHGCVYIYVLTYTEKTLIQLWKLFWKKSEWEVVISVTNFAFFSFLCSQSSTQLSHFLLYIWNYFSNYVHQLNARFLGTLKTLPASFKLINLHPTDLCWVTARISWYSGIASIFQLKKPHRGTDFSYKYVQNSVPVNIFKCCFNIRWFLRTLPVMNIFTRQ